MAANAVRPGVGRTAPRAGAARGAAGRLAFDDLPANAGQLTTATAMGEALTYRLIAAGITFRVLKA